MQLLLQVSSLVVFTGYAIALDARVHSNQVCRTDADCKENSFCFGNDVAKPGNCKCSDGYTLFGNTTMYECSMPIEGIGSSCTFDEQCEQVLGVDSECDARNQCRCLPSAHHIANKCFKTAQPGEICLSNENCFPLETFECVSGKCSCPMNHHITPDNKCVRSLHLGELCEVDESCIHMNAVCRLNCQCRLGYVTANNEHNCLQAATNLGDACEQLSQCNTYISNSVCTNGRCACQPDHHRYGNGCYKSRSLGEGCAVRQECVRDAALENLVDCEAGVCTCKYGSRSKDDCVETSAVHFINNANAYLLAAILFMVL